MFDVSDDLYALLEVSPLATQAEIKTAYRAAAKKYHPDVYHGPDAQQRFQKINAAYDVLKDPIQRASYDSFLGSLNSSKAGHPGNNHDDTYDRTTGGGVTFDPVDIDHNLYTELDLPLYASPEEIKKAFMDLSEKYDPNKSLVPNAREKIRKITLAYQILSDSIMKERYDFLLKVLLKHNPKSEPKNDSYSYQDNSYARKTSSSQQNTSANSASYNNTPQGANAEKAATYRSATEKSYYYDSDSNKSQDTYDQTVYHSGLSRKSSDGCAAFLLFVLLFLVFLGILQSCSTGNSSTSAYKRSSSNTSSFVRKTSTPVNSGSSTTYSGSVRKTPTPTKKNTPLSGGSAYFIEHNVNISVGQDYKLNFYIPNNNHKYTYTYKNSEILVKRDGSNSSFIITGMKEGEFYLSFKDESGNIVDRCIITVNNSSQSSSKQPTPTVFNKNNSETWAFDKTSLKVALGQSVEIKFITKPHTAYSFSLSNPNIIEVEQKKEKTLTVTGVRTGISEIYLKESSGVIVAVCTVSVSYSSKNSPKMPTPAPTLQIINTADSKSVSVITSTPTPVPKDKWAFEKSDINLGINQSVELDFIVPQNAAYSFSLSKSGIVRIGQKDYNTLFVTGLKVGMTKLYITSRSGLVTAVCNVYVHRNFITDKKTPTPLPGSVKTPTPLPHKVGGYTENELIENGHVAVRNPDGTIRYPGFYQAPNGNYYPTGN